jgi:hypothetical protein
MTTQVRRVRRIVRKFDPWTVLKVSLVFYLVVALAFVLGSIIFWRMLTAAGIPDMVESTLANFLSEFLSTATLIPADDQLFRAAVFLAIAGAVLASGVTTLMAVMYNLISDVVGGIEVVVLEEIVPQQLHVQVAAPVAPPPARDLSGVEDETEVLWG